MKVLWSGELHVRDMYSIQCVAEPLVQNKTQPVIQTDGQLKQILAPDIMDTCGKLEATEFWSYLRCIHHKIIVLRFLPILEDTGAYNAMYSYLYRQGTCLIMAKVSSKVSEFCVIPDRIPQDIELSGQVSEQRALLGVLVLKAGNKLELSTDCPRIYYISDPLLPTFRAHVPRSTTYQIKTEISQNVNISSQEHQTHLERHISGQLTSAVSESLSCSENLSTEKRKVGILSSRNWSSQQSTKPSSAISTCFENMSVIDNDDNTLTMYTPYTQVPRSTAKPQHSKLGVQYPSKLQTPRNETTSHSQPTCLAKLCKSGTTFQNTKQTLIKNKVTLQSKLTSQAPKLCKTNFGNKEHFEQEEIVFNDCDNNRVKGEISETHSPTSHTSRLSSEHCSSQNMSTSLNVSDPDTLREVGSTSRSVNVSDPGELGEQRTTSGSVNVSDPDELREVGSTSGSVNVTDPDELREVRSTSGYLSNCSENESSPEYGCDNKSVMQKTLETHLHRSRKRPQTTTSSAKAHSKRTNCRNMSSSSEASMVSTRSEHLSTSKHENISKYTCNRRINKTPKIPQMSGISPKKCSPRTSHGSKSDLVLEEASLNMEKPQHTTTVTSPLGSDSSQNKSNSKYQLDHESENTFKRHTARTAKRLYRTKSKSDCLLEDSSLNLDKPSMTFLPTAVTRSQGSLSLQNKSNCKYPHDHISENTSKTLKTSEKPDRTTKSQISSRMDLPKQSHMDPGISQEAECKVRKRPRKTLVLTSGVAHTTAEKKPPVSGKVHRSKTNNGRNKAPRCCKQCSRQFTDRSNLLKHQLTHSSLKPFTCTLCPAAFNTSYSLGRHQLVHKNNTRHACQFCEKVFTQPHNLTSHVKHLHSKERSFECAKCGQLYKYRFTRKRHEALCGGLSKA